MASVQARSSRGRRRGMSEINMVPFIDVMLVLLTIFMVTAPLITTGNIDLPSVSKSAAPETSADVLTLSITQQGQYQLSSKRQGVLLEGEKLPEIISKIQALQTNDRQVPVVIAGDKKLSYEVVMQAMDALRKADVQQVGLVVAQP